MTETKGLITGVVVAGLVAGPLFLAALTLLSYQEQAGAAIEIRPSAVRGSILLLALSVPFGLVLAFPTCLIVGSILRGLAAPFPILRSTALWLLVAAFIAIGIVSAFGQGLGAGGLAFALTAIACAAIVRARLHWD